MGGRPGWIRSNRPKPRRWDRRERDRARMASYQVFNPRAARLAGRMETP